MKGEYNKVNKNTRLNMEYGDFSKFKNNLEIDDENRGMDYDRYKYDINGIDEEKENLMIQYLEDKQKAINGLPKLVPPNQKVNFNYDEIKSPNFKNLNNNKNNINNYINTSSSQVNNINNNTTSINNENNINQKNDDNIKDINFNENNINNDINNINNNNNDNNIYEHNNENFNKNNNNIETNINNNNKEYNSQVSNNNNINNKTEKIINSNIIPENDNNNIPKNNYMQSDYNNEENNLNGKDNIDPTETLNNFKEKMSAASKAILTGPTILPNSSQKSKQKSDPSKKAYDSYMRNIQPRSSGSKITYQNFKKPNKPRQKIIQNEFKKKPNRYNVGKYPSEYENNKMNEFLEKNPSRPVNKNLKVFEQENLEEEIKRIVDINIKKAFNLHQLNKNNIETSQIRKNNYQGNNNDELLKVLIQKFDDIENAIRETNYNKSNEIDIEKNMNEKLADEIFAKIYSQINSKIRNINIKK